LAGRGCFTKPSGQGNFASRKERLSTESWEEKIQQGVPRENTSHKDMLQLLIALLVKPFLPTFAHDYVLGHAAGLAHIGYHAGCKNDVMVPMRDGVHLSADILFPNGQPGKRLPDVNVCSAANAN
jgi:predicted acyl esterase